MRPTKILREMIEEFETSMKHEAIFELKEKLESLIVMWQNKGKKLIYKAEYSDVTRGTTLLLCGKDLEKILNETPSKLKGIEKND